MLQCSHQLLPVSLELSNFLRWLYISHDLCNVLLNSLSSVLFAGCDAFVVSVFVVSVYICVACYMWLLSTPFPNAVSTKNIDVIITH